jgi:glycosyltransferase involved in cell wall biosynthesis
LGTEILLARYQNKLDGNLKVCVISTESIPVYGGIGAYTTQLVEHLPENIEVHLVTVKRNIPGIHEKNIYSQSNSLKRKVIFHYLSSSNDSFLYYPIFQLACFRKLEQLHKEFKFDIVHTQFPVMPDVLMRLFSKVGIPTVCTVHSTVETQMDSIKLANTNFSALDRTEKGNMLLYYPLKVLEYLYLKKVDWYIAVSDFVRTKLVSSYSFLNEEKILTLYHGIDVEKYFPFPVEKKPVLGTDEDQPIVLFTGRMVAKKGPQVLIRAIPKVLESVPNACFVFAGAEDFSPYMTLLSQLKIKKENYRYLGYVSTSDMPSLYNTASVYAAPSFEDSLGIRILEAMSCRRPVVASDIGGVHEIVTDQRNGLLVKPGRVDKLAEKIVELLKNRELREKIASASQQTVLERFSSRRMANETAALYYRILNDVN